MKVLIQELEEKLNRTSKNSSSPPSTDPLNVEKKAEKKKSEKKVGEQPGHQRFEKVLYPESECAEVINHKPELCSSCGSHLEGEDDNPIRHQYVEIPPIKPIIIEHRLHQLECVECGKSTRAKLPADVEPNHYGTRIVALVAVLSGLYRHSQRMVKTAMEEIFDIRLSLGTINKLRMEASTSLELAVGEAKTYVQNAAVVGADETSFSQGNMDECNAKKHSFYGGIIRSAVKDWKQEVMVLILDTTMLWNEYCIVRVCVEYRGRAVPMGWRVLRHKSSSVSFEVYSSLLLLKNRLKGSTKESFGSSHIAILLEFCQSTRSPMWV